MSEEAANQDYGYPWAQKLLYTQVSVGSFASEEGIQIYWGPGQLTNFYPGYNPPDPDKWRIYEHLNIPVVVRFIYTNNSTYNKDDYSNDAGGGGTKKKTWTVVNVEILYSFGVPPNKMEGYRVFWEIEGDPLHTSVNYFNSFPNTPSAHYAGLTLELPYDKVPNYSNDGSS